MNLKLLVMLTAFAAAFLWLGAAASAEEFNFIGVPGCTDKCHNTEEEGDQLAVWKDAEHSEAYETLGTDKAKERAAKVGVDKNPQRAPNCLICHVTGFGKPASRFDRKYDYRDGVQCESCHGPGSGYKRKKIMKQITEERGADREGESPTAQKYGLTLPDEDDCRTCHTEEREFNGQVFENPSFEEFDFEERFEEIEHPIPEARLAEYQ